MAAVPCVVFVHIRPPGKGLRNVAGIPVSGRIAEPSVRSVLVFFALTFGIAWGGMGLTYIFQDAVEAALGPMGPTHPLFILAVWSPAISAILLVLWYGGLPGLRRYLSRLLLWRAPVGWYPATSAC